MHVVKSVLCNASFARKTTTCNTITEAKARKTMLRRRGRCFVCLRWGILHQVVSQKANALIVAICENPKKPIQPSGSEAEVASTSRSESSQERTRDV